MSSTIIVSNRLPINISIEQDKIIYQQSIGGLATGLKSFHEDENSLWVGWNGLNTEEVPEALEKTITDELKTK
jgi:trehalose 6-phosphate synthase/phosphatase